MTIIRDGKEIILTDKERADAFMEHLKEHIRCDVIDYVESECDYVHFESDEQKNDFINEVVESLYDSYDCLGEDFISRDHIAWRVEDTIHDFELGEDDDEYEE